ncbi:hypothetical protein ACIBG8_19885 [Nonomuraea sp. NPDC050556]|uniref:hypothetical protein n=1 Tax=Nonomuraea sp. NPDC050556 TaxID=3364369 RepID=UPI00379FE461
MRKTIVASLLVAVVGLSGVGLAGAAQASDSGPGVQTPVTAARGGFSVSSKGGAPVKSGPGKAYDTIDWLPFGTRVTGTISGNWVNIDGGGFVYLGRLQKPRPTRAYSAYVADPAGAPLRSGPGKGYPVVGRLDFGDKVIGTPQGKWLKTLDGYVLRAKLSS